MLRLKYNCMMVLGWLCYWPVMAWPGTLKNRALTWALAWAGFYAHADGFENWRHRSSNV